MESAEYPVENAECSPHFLYSTVAEPIDMDDEQQDTDGPHKLDDLGKSAQIVFMLHKVSVVKIRGKDNRDCFAWCCFRQVGTFWHLLAL